MNSKYLWGLGSGRGMAIGVDMVKRPDCTTFVSLPKRLLFEDLSAKQQSKVVECVDNLNAAGTYATIDMVMDIANKFAPPTSFDDIVQKMIADVRAKAHEIETAARKQRNKAKRERRARRGK